MSGSHPLSLSQREVWLDYRAYPDSAHLNIGGCCFLDGPLDRERLAQALGLLVVESEALRLVPLPEGGQRLLERVGEPLEFHDFGDVDDPSAAIRQWWQAAFRRPLSLDGEGRPWRVELLRADDRRHGVMILFHHLVMDGWGTARVFQRWAELYNALEAGEAPPASGDPGYLRFIEESLAYADSTAYAKDAAFWREHLPVPPEPLIEPRRAARADGALPEARLHTHLLARELYDRLGRFAEGQGGSVFHLFLAALALYYGRLHGRREVVIGVPSLNRGGRRYKATLGMFVGVFPLKVTLPEEGTVAELLAEVAAALRAAYRHPRYPLSALGRELELIRHGRDRLFDVLLSFERQDYAVRFGEAVLTEARQLFTGVARYPLALTVCEFHPEQPVELVLEGAADCFAEGEPALLARRLHHLVEALAADAGAPLAAADPLPAEERRELIDGIHAEVPHHDDPTPFIAAFEHQAALRPDADALLWEAGRLEYGELNRRANRLAHRLRELGVGREEVVALVMERSPQVVAAILAVAKAGCAFLPLDPDAPLERLADIVRQSDTPLLLTQSHLLERLAALDVPLLALDAADSPLLDASLPDGNPDAPPTAGELAYVLFTSGSSGRPKGVMVEHGALARRLAWLARNYAISPRDRAGQSTQLIFDPALIELLLPLSHGASVALPPPGRLPAERLARFAAAFGVTFIAFVPSTLARFLAAAEGLDGLRLRVACCGGEVLPPAVAERFTRRTGGRLYNVYGPTEATIFATAWACETLAEGEVLPVGRPVDDSRIYVLDDAMQPRPTGEAGEIYIGGGGLARGYLGRPDLDAEAFRADPFVPGGRIYRTGDRGYWGADGNLHFLGRVDRQVKLRGYRIEPGEIEAALAAEPGVRAAAVKLVGREGRRALHAWVATQPGAAPTAEALQRALRRRLPDYMLPRGITALPRLPERVSGKIDYSALPEPVEGVVNGGGGRPRNGLEGRLVELWQEVLGRTSIGIHDNFFERGGDSLAAVTLLSAVDALSGRRNPLSLLTEHPTVAELAAALAGRMGAGSLLVTLGEEGGYGETPLYLAASGHGDALRLAPLAKALAGTYTLHMLQPPLAASGVPFRTLGELAERYADLIQERTLERDDPPPLLAGFSVGGITALETARVLAARGVAIRRLVLLDTVYPHWLMRRALPWRLSAWLVRTLRFQEVTMNGRTLGSLFSDPGLSAQVCAQRSLRPQPYAGPATLIVSSGVARWERVLFGPWCRLLGAGLEVCRVAGHHGTIFNPEHVAELAARLRGDLPPESPQPPGET
ncbi:non-ribosomal peptide synthetase [Endothiovibrio diazotrophicus]